MPINNMISIAFTQEELNQMDAALETLEKLFAGKVVQLTPKESQRYGRLGHETENWTNVIFEDVRTAPQLVPPFISQEEWAKDEKARDQLSARATRLENLAQQVSDTNRVIGFDIYQTCLSVYNNARYLSTQNVAGTKSYYEKWSVQFPGRKGKKPAPKQEEAV